MAGQVVLTQAAQTQTSAVQATSTNASAFSVFVSVPGSFTNVMAPPEVLLGQVQTWLHDLGIITPFGMGIQTGARVVGPIFGAPAEPTPAERRARRLLERIVPPELVKRWDRDGRIDIPSRRHRGRTYRLRKQGGSFYAFIGEPLLDVLVDGRPYARVCLHVGENLPFDDRVVGKYLLCAFAEEEVEEAGNWTFEGERWDEVRDAPAVVVALEA